jgi:hypothetical protein
MDVIEANKFEEYVKNLLECPVCMETIQLAPIHQCTNGHVLCKDCIAKLESCPICRNDSNTARNLIFEQIIGNFIANQEPCEKLELQKWEKVCVGASFSNNRPNEEPSVQLNVQPNSETIKSVELGEKDNLLMSTTSKTNKFEGLLECLNCNEPIKTTHIHQCTNGHVVCKDCITKLDNCLNCKNDSKIARNLIFEQIIDNFSAFELENEKPFEEPEHKELGASLSSNGLNEELSIQLDIQPNSETMESVELGETDNRTRSTLKCDDMILSFWNCFKNLCVPVLYLIGFISFCIFLFLVFFNYFMYCVVGVDIGIFTPLESCNSKYTGGTFLR